MDFFSVFWISRNLKPLVNPLLVENSMGYGTTVSSVTLYYNLNLSAQWDATFMAQKHAQKKIGLKTNICISNIIF